MQDRHEGRYEGTDEGEGGHTPKTPYTPVIRRAAPTGVVDGYDYDLRPDYWDPDDPRTILVGRIAGDVRRRFVLAAVEGRLDEGLLGDEDREDFVSERRRQELTAMHPQMMGGEYLPPYDPGQTEIARIVMYSVTRDTLSVRARWDGGLIHYSVHDEYPEYGGTQAVCPPLVTERPLTFGEMVVWVEGFESGWMPQPNHFFDSVREGNVDGGASIDDMRHFVWIESPYYPQLHAHFQAQADEWYARMRADYELEEEDEDDEDDEEAA